MTAAVSLGACDHNGCTEPAVVTVPVALLDPARLCHAHAALDPARPLLDLCACGRYVGEHYRGACLARAGAFG